MQAAQRLAPDLGLKAACEALMVPRAAVYRSRGSQEPAGVAAQPEAKPKPRPSPSRALAPSERQAVLDLLHSERFVDHAPHQVYATLLDEGRYCCSIRTMYRILDAHAEVKERRNHLRHPSYAKPELLATGPNEVWSWDITKLRGPEKWVYFYLYVILDIFSRYAVGWMVATRESAELALRLIEETTDKHAIRPGTLTIHSDRGAPMKAKPVAMLLSDLGIAKTHSRPHVSDDNPFSEAHFKTLKYRPEFPDRFGSLEDARSFCRSFFRWYNQEHRHTGLALLAPAAVHYGHAEEVLRARAAVLEAAYKAHPERFVNKQPQPKPLPAAAWINPPKPPADGAEQH
jgi:putative transposase